MTTDSQHADWLVDHVLVRLRPGVDETVVVGRATEWQAWWHRLTDSADPVVALAGKQGFVITTAQLTQLASRAQQRTAVRNGRWQVPLRGVIAPIAVADEDAASAGPYDAARRRHAIAASAAALVRPGFVISGRSAALLHGLPTRAVPQRPELTALHDVRLGRRCATNVRGARLERPDVARWFGAPVTGVPRTIVDLARHDRRDAIMAADAALHERLLSPGGLAAALAQAAGWPGVRQAREVLTIASALAESPLESLTRLALHDSGFPVPDLQVTIRDEGRNRSYRVDVLFAGARLVLEMDGRGKYTADELWREKTREKRLIELGYRVERVTWDDVVRHWPETAGRIRVALRS